MLSSRDLDQSSCSRHKRKLKLKKTKGTKQHIQTMSHTAHAHSNSDSHSFDVKISETKTYIIIFGEQFKLKNIERILKYQSAMTQSDDNGNFYIISLGFF